MILTFKQFLNEAARVGLPHIDVPDSIPQEKRKNVPTVISKVSAAYQNLQSLIGTDKLKAPITEKTDGSTYRIGHDQNGFFTETSNSGRIYSKGDYAKQAKEKHGHKPDFDPALSTHFDELHHHLASNHNLVSYLKSKAEASPNGESTIKGEIFYKPFGQTSNDGKHITFVGTKYNTSQMSKNGSFIVHSQLPENQGHDIEHLTRLGNHSININHDKIDHPGLDLDVSDLNERLKNVDPSIRTRKHPHWPEVESIASDLRKRIGNSINNIKPKFGPETEGYVFHGPIRFKHVPDGYAQRKKEVGKY